MSRLILFKGKGPIPEKEPFKAICTCGLSKTYPYCSGAHIHVVGEGEDEVYVYNSHGRLLGRVRKIILDNGVEIIPSEVYSQDVIGNIK